MFFLKNLIRTRNVNINFARFINKSALNLCINKTPNAHKVNNLEKRFLVWTGKYKNIADVPNAVPSEVVEKARNKMRIRIANIMMGLTLVACLFVSLSGKKAHERGESVLKQNLAWHESIKNEPTK